MLGCARTVVHGRVVQPDSDGLPVAQAAVDLLELRLVEAGDVLLIRKVKFLIEAD